MVSALSKMERHLNMSDFTISILGSQTSPGSEEEQFELITEGQFTHAVEKSEISYLDSETTGFAGSQTTFIVEPEKITLTRDTWYGGDMVFDEAEKHHFLYQTPFGSLTMGIATERVSSELGENGGNLQIKYALDVDNIVISRNSFNITVKPA